MELNHYLDLRQIAKHKVNSPLTPIVGNIVLGAEQEEHYERYLVLGSLFRRRCKRSVVGDYRRPKAFERRQLGIQGEPTYCASHPFASRRLPIFRVVGSGPHDAFRRATSGKGGWLVPRLQPLR